MRTILVLIVLLLAFVLGTVFCAWWSVPILGLFWGLLAGSKQHAACKAAAAAAASWALLLAWTGSQGPLGHLAERLAGVFMIPGWALLLVTCLFPALLAGTAATLGSGFRRGSTITRETNAAH